MAKGNILRDRWVYFKNDDNSVRYVLGEKGKKVLVCFGVNPSTATPEKLDRTLSRVRNESLTRGFDGWIMLNLYPQRATDPGDLHKEFDISIHQSNLSKIKGIFKDYSDVIVWAAWGGVIQRRSYLKQCLEEIVKTVPSSIKWWQMGDCKHPHHPLYLKKGMPFLPFDINKYLNEL